MAVKKFDIEIPKMDYQEIFVNISKNGEQTKLGENDLIFMTVKRFAGDDKFIFQKSLNNGISYDDITEKYKIEINSEDTKNMDFNKEYGYDITIYYDGNKPKQKIIGKFKVGTKYTLNEVI